MSQTLLCQAGAALTRTSISGNYGLEVTIPHAVAPLDSALGLGGVCANCTANEFALQGYLEYVSSA